MISPLATVISSPRSGSMRPSAVYGIALHTTGSGLPRDAIAQGKDPFQYGVDWYRSHTEGPTYLIGWNGQIAAITPDERMKTAHIGIKSDEVQPIINGGWRAMVPPQTAAMWNRRWGASRNPLDLIAGYLPNDVLVGIEMIPTTDGSTSWATPLRPGLRFTGKQHAAARELAADIAQRHSLPVTWRWTRLFGHEDINPLRRSDAGGGWDPGVLREHPYLDLSAVRSSMVGELLVGAAVGLAAWLILRR